MMEQEAAEILRHIIYATVATAGARGEPWNSSVYVVYDNQLYFYWASGKTSRHSRNIKENPQVFLVIYDSTGPWGQGKGVFIQGEAEEVVDPGEIAKACQLRKARASGAKHPPEEFSPDKPRSIYKMTPLKLWMNQDGKVNGYFVDERTELEPDRLLALLTRIM